MKDVRSFSRLFNKYVNIVSLLFFADKSPSQPLCMESLEAFNWPVCSMQ